MLLTEVQTYSLTHLANIPFSSAVSVDHCFAFITEKGIDILELVPDPRSVSPSLGCRRYVIKPPTSLPTASLGIDPSDLLPHLDKQDAYALISDVSLSPKLVRTITPTPAPRAVHWSPLGILPNHRCILSILTDMGGLALYTVGQDSNQVADISSLWLTHCQASWTKPQTSSSVSHLLRELRLRAESVKITAMCWFGEGGKLVTVSKSGLVAMWEVRSRDANTQELEVTLSAKFGCGLQNVTEIHWTSLTTKFYLLIVGSQDGRLRGFTFPPIESSLDLNDPMLINPTQHDIWNEMDKIAPTHLTSWAWKDGLLVVAVKGAFLLAFYLDEQGNKVAYCAYRCSDISINGLSHVSESEMLIATRSARMTRLSLSLSSEKLCIATVPVENYINVSHMGCYGLNMTVNKVICFILLSVNQSYDHLRLREPSQVVICSVLGLLDPQNVLQNPHKPVSELWDCLELLRLHILQETVVPEVSYPQAVLDTMTIDQLVITMWWTTFATAAEDDDDANHQNLLSLRREVETLVVSCHFFKRIASLLSCPVETLTPFQLHSLGLVAKWLVGLQKLPPEFVTTLITARTLQQQLEALEPHFPTEELCTICGSRVNLMAELFIAECEKGHRLPRCSLSLVQCCQLPYYVCAQCGALGHPEAVQDFGVSCYLCGGVLRIDEDILPLK